MPYYSGTHRIYYEASGPEAGHAVVLLHHGLGSIQAWKAQLPALAEAGFHTIAFDRWGYGRSDLRQALSVPYFEDDLADLEGLLEELGISKVSLVGHSDGGTIGLYYAVRHPEQVAGLVTVAAHIYVEPKMLPGIQGVRHAYESDPRFSEGLRRVHGHKVEAVFYNWYNGWTQERNLTWDMRPLLGQVTCPTLVVQGLEDEHATPQHARDIAAAIPKAKLWLVEDARHMLPQERAEEFNGRVIRFLEQLGEINVQ
jgi:pimeloyl-ACP methyl ester carboxylesterase